MQIIVFCNINWFFEIIINHILISSFHQQSSHNFCIRRYYCQMQRCVIPLFIRFIDITSPSCQIIHSILTPIRKFIDIFFFLNFYFFNNFFSKKYPRNVAQCRGLLPLLSFWFMLNPLFLKKY